MSQRAFLTQTPETHMHLFSRVTPEQVQPGDVYKGKNRSRKPKWYANTEGQGCVDRHRQYYRPVTPIPQSQLGPLLGNKPHVAPAGEPGLAGGSAGTAGQQHAPGAACAAGPMEEADDEHIELFTISVSKSGLAKLMAMANDIEDARG